MGDTPFPDSGVLPEAERAGIRILHMCRCGLLAYRHKKPACWAGGMGRGRVLRGSSRAERAVLRRPPAVIVRCKARGVGLLRVLISISCLLLLLADEALVAGHSSAAASRLKEYKQKKDGKS